MSNEDPLSLFDRLMAVKPAGLARLVWSERAGLSRAVFTDIKRRGSANHSTIEKLLDAIGVTFAEFEAGHRATEKEPSPSEVRAPYLAFRAQDRPRDVPILGTAECADLEFEANDHPVSVESMELDFNEIVDYARRPASLDNRRDVYCLYWRGHSMSPRFEPGEIGYIDPSRPPGIRDYAVLQLRKPDDTEGERVARVIAKRLVRTTASFYELEQFNPPTTFRVPREMVKHIHRVMSLDELVSF